MDTKAIQIIEPQSTNHLDEVRKLLWEYARIRKFDAALGDYKAEIEGLPGAFKSPSGALFLARFNGQPAGCVASRPIGDNITEMKRLFVLPEFRGLGIGRLLAQKILEQAQKQSYHRMRLDTHPWMESAQQLYDDLGFVEIPAYRFNPTPGIRFFEKKLV